MGILAIAQLVFAVLAAVKTGTMTVLEIRAMFKKYQTLQATPENIEKLRNEILDAAKRKLPKDDPAIRAQLEADGFNPEDFV